LKVAVSVCIAFLLSAFFIPFVSADWPMFHLNPAHTGVSTSDAVLSPMQLWNYTTPNSPIEGSPAITNGAVYIGAGGAVCSLNATNGAVLWQRSMFSVGSSPAVVDGVVYTSGNITASQISSVTINANQSAGKTEIAFTVTGQSGTLGVGNITIAKSAVPYGTTPTINIDNQKAENQGYSQDTDNYYVWYTAHFSTHNVSIAFTTPAQTPIRLIIIAVISVIAVVAVGTGVLALRKRKD